MYYPRILVDFDHTICPGGDESNPPTHECLEVLNRLKATGYQICIFSVRSNSNQTQRKTGHQDMLDYLKRYNVPYDDIEYNKIHSHLIIDDRCCGIPLDRKKNVDWSKVKQLLDL